MSANLVDPRERLNYFNGERLAAADFRAEQGHHDGMRGVLNSMLYSPGVVSGLEVEIDRANRDRVKVGHGLAFDYLGRELFVPQEVLVQAMGGPGSVGNLLTVSYREQPRSRASGDRAWGAPTRIAADVVFEVLDSWPADESGKVVLAQLELDAYCRVARVVSDVRKYAAPVKPQKVRPISLEGEKDIDLGNEKTLHFHIEDGAPERAVLVLRARKFSSTYYTEIGEHVHPLSLFIADHPAPPGHSHTLPGVETDKQLDPSVLDFYAWVWHRPPDVFNGNKAYAFQLWADPGGAEQDLDAPKSSLGPELRVYNTLHSHGFAPGAKTDEWDGVGPLVHDVKQSTQSFGATAAVPPPHQLQRDGNPEYGYIRNLQVVLDGSNDITAAILAQLARRPGEAMKWRSLGDGTAAHAIVSQEGTGEIDLLALGFELGMGAHKLTFRLVTPKPGDADYTGDPAKPVDRGGCIQYNLYID